MKISFHKVVQSNRASAQLPGRAAAETELSEEGEPASNENGNNRPCSLTEHQLDHYLPLLCVKQIV